MSSPEIGGREEWIRARVVLLEREKALTRARDQLVAQRRQLPMVEVAEDYRFTAADGGSRTLLDLRPRERVTQACSGSSLVLAAAAPASVTRGHVRRPRRVASRS